MPSPLDYAMTVAVGSPDVSRNPDSQKSRLRSGVPTPGPLASLLIAIVRNPNVRPEFQQSEVLTCTKSSDVDLLMLTLTLP